MSTENAPKVRPENFREEVIPMWTHPLSALPIERQAGNQALDRRQLFFADKGTLDQAIEQAARYGWKLASRCYSGDRGHGADLVRPRMNKAA